MEYGITITPFGNEIIERGIRKTAAGFTAINDDEIRNCRSLETAIKYLNSKGIDAFGNFKPVRPVKMR